MDWVDLLCVLGGDGEHGKLGCISDYLWHVDTECIEDHGNYVRLLEHFVILAHGALPLQNLRDHVDLEAGEAWVEFDLDGKTTHWDLPVSDDWMAPELYSHLQALVAARSDKRFFITALGQDSLISFGTAALKEKLSELSGLKFQWE